MPYFPPPSLPLRGGTVTGIITSTNINPLLTPAESWVGPSSTTGIYFKGGFVGVGTITPTVPLHVVQNGSGYLFPVVIENTGDPGAGATRLNVKNSVCSFLLQAYGSGAPGALETKGSIINDVGSGLILGSSNGGVQLYSANSYSAPQFTLDTAGHFGFGESSPTAVIHLTAGTATAGTAPQKFTSGTLNTTAEAGAEEFLTDNRFFTITTGAARKAYLFDDGARLTSGKIPIASTNGRLIDGQTPLAGTKIYYTSDTSGGAVTRKLTFIAGILTAET